MAARENSVKRYVVRLSAEDRDQLESFIRKGKSPAQRCSRRSKAIIRAGVNFHW
jgi:hypothetical protein